ncbi:hypothetical protein GIB67_008327 [Kingdonia uniflora]|uniref:Homeobox domain-containing protein n=1 Tax=Kingdonia uniflora TaxID=39325 RepID=A0A7J7N5K8_9MAGN|nr:hypothetical protein GIB67_008327 [Kingdonia uniflora]
MGSESREEMRFSTHIVNQIQAFESNPHELYNLATSMEMLTFPPPTPPVRKNNITDPGCSSSSKMITDHHQHQLLPSSSDFYQPQVLFNRCDFSQDQYVDDSSLRSVFPCEGSERPNQGLSLSLSTKLPSTVGLQSFDLGETSYHQHLHDQQDGFFEKPPPNLYQQHQFFEVGGDLDHERLFELKNSKYLGPAQELLNEICRLESEKHQTPNKVKQQPRVSSFESPSLDSLELFELQSRKTKLMFMLDQVDRRYKQYCDRLKATESSFEAVAGLGTATRSYTASASNAMSKHFRCLRDGIMNQLKATKRALEKKGPAGSKEGETPRLRLLDQSLRQHSSFQQMNMVAQASTPWRPQRGLPERSVGILRDWLMGNFLNPYPTELDKRILASQTGLSKAQVSNWFINARVRLWKPMVEEMYLEETKEQDNIESLNGVQELDENSRPVRPYGHNYNHVSLEDQKPTLEQLARNDSGSLTSIISNPDIGDHLAQQQHQFGRVSETFGQTDLDFSSYNTDFIHDNLGYGVSLTLGLQQHGGSGMNMSFSSSGPSQDSAFFSRHHLDHQDCQHVPYLMLDGSTPSLPYSN